MGPRKSVVTKRSLRSGDIEPDKRPKRVVQTKPVDDSVGLSRQEEQELNKALYASLNETRRSKSLPSLGSIDNPDFTVRVGSHEVSRTTDKPHSSKGNNVTLGKKRSLRGGVPLAKHLFRSDSTGSSENDNLNIDESSKDSVKSSSSSANGSKRKIHAQRKFAQGCSLPGTPTCSPAKASTTPVKLLSRTPKTEDFLTFLCLRGSPALPPHLDFFNFSKEELPLRGDSPKLTPSGRRKRIHEACLDEDSSSSGGVNEDAGEKPPSAEKIKVTSSSKRSAARASAGTSETARGLVSLRRDLQRKVSSSSSSSSSSSLRMCRHSQSCLVLASQHSTNTARVLHRPTYSPHKPRYYFMPHSSSSLPAQESGVLPGEFTPPSKTCHMEKHSPLIYWPSPSRLANRTPSLSPLSPLASTGASKRKRSSSFFSSDCGSCQGSSVGALTPVSSSPASNYRSQSSQKGSGSRGKHRHVPATIAVLKSARKNLLGKLTSVARQSEKIVVKPMKRLQATTGSGRLSKENKSLKRSGGSEARVEGKEG